MTLPDGIHEKRLGRLVRYWLVVDGRRVADFPSMSEAMQRVGDAPQAVIPR